VNRCEAGCGSRLYKGTKEEREWVESWVRTKRGNAHVELKACGAEPACLAALTPGNRRRALASSAQRHTNHHPANVAACPRRRPGCWCGNGALNKSDGAVVCRRFAMSRPGSCRPPVRPQKLEAITRVNTMLCFVSLRRQCARLQLKLVADRRSAELRRFTLPQGARQAATSSE
jgi:hypothetical protein